MTTKEKPAKYTKTPLSKELRVQKKGAMVYIILLY